MVQIERSETALAAPTGSADSRLYPQERLAPLIARFTRRYRSFADPAYRDEERFYKQTFAERARTLLSREALEQRIAAGEFKAAKDAVMQATGGSVTTPSGSRQSNNLLNQWDRLAIQNAPDEELARRLYALLYGDGPFEARFDAWVAPLASDRPGVWPPATYLLMLFDPTAQIMVKPTQWQQLFDELGIDFDWSTRPNATFYSWLQAIAQQLLQDLAPLGARDLLDVQSFIWVVSTKEQDGASVDPPQAVEAQPPAVDPRPEPPTRTPAIYAEEAAGFWRIHLPREFWERARQAGVIGIGWPSDSQNQSVKRFRQIRVGDRVAVYLQGGMIGGIGVVTRAFDPEYSGPRNWALAQLA